MIGFGGYPTLPPIIAARTLRHPDRHPRAECRDGPRQPAARARRRPRSRCSFVPTKLLQPEAEAKARLTGTPVRDAVLAFRNVPYVAPEPAGRLLLLDLRRQPGRALLLRGRAAGAAPAAGRRCAGASPSCSRRARRTWPACARPIARRGIAAHLAPFFRDLPERIATAHLVIARAGASTVAELMAIGRPCLLVPLPHALDNDQLENATRPARRRAAAGACSQSGA